MSILRRALIKASGSRLVQRALEKNVQVSQYLMGIGSGGGVDESGERAVFDVMRRRARAPYCIVDAGANRGQFLDLALRSLGSESASIHCFEPGREAYRRLAERSSGDARVTLNKKGVGIRRGEATLHYNVEGSGLASLSKRRLGHFGVPFEMSEQVEIDTIDDYCGERGIQRIDLLKMDIEGHELDALAGARRMFDARSISVVTFEFGGCNIDSRSFFQDFWYFFADVGMKISRITPSGYLYAIESYKEIDEQFRATNFVASLG